jgi:hypothetical protein
LSTLRLLDDFVPRLTGSRDETQRAADPGTQSVTVTTSKLSQRAFSLIEVLADVLCTTYDNERDNS